MKTITIGFSKSSKKFAFFSKLIMWSRGINYSHTYLKFDAVWDDRAIYYQASHTMVNYMSKERFLAEETIVKEFEFQISDDKFVKMQDFCLDKSAEPYGVLSIIGFSLKIILSKIGINIKNPIKDANKAPVCSQLVALIIECLDGSIKIDPNDMDPFDLMKVVDKLPKILS